MINKLDEKNIELTKILFDLKQSLDLHKLVVLNAEQINKNAGKSFFVHAQRLALKSFALDICKIFEEKKKNKLNSIPAIIDFIQGSNLKPKYSQIIETYIKKNGEKVTKKLSYGAPLRRIIQKFRAKNKSHFDKFKLFRDTKVAHAEDSSKTKINLLPSYDAMEKLLFFGIDFYSMIHETYIGGYPVDHKRYKRVSAGLYSILNKLGYNNVKKDFEN